MGLCVSKYVCKFDSNELDEILLAAWHIKKEFTTMYFRSAVFPVCSSTKYKQPVHISQISMKVNNKHEIPISEEKQNRRKNAF